MENTFTMVKKFKKPFLFASSQMSNMTYSNYGILKNLGEKYSQILDGLVVKFWNVYGIEHDLRDTAGDIDTSKCMLYVLGGDYDWSANPAACKELCDAVKCSSYTLMEGMGHFPMSEDPAKFKEYLLPVLTQIEAGFDKTS